MSKHTARRGETVRSIPTGRCADCGKFTYASRRDAERGAIRARGPAHGLDAYRCPVGVGWHLGHLPRAVKRGEIGRDQIATASRPTPGRGQIVICCGGEVVGIAHPNGTIEWRCTACTRSLRLPDDEANQILGALWAAGVRPTLELVGQARGRGVA